MTNMHTAYMVFLRFGLLEKQDVRVRQASLHVKSPAKHHHTQTHLEHKRTTRNTLLFFLHGTH